MLNKTLNILPLGSVVLLRLSLAAFSSFYPQPTLANPTEPSLDAISTRAADLLPAQQCEPASASPPVALSPLSPPAVANPLGSELAVPETQPSIGRTQPLSAEAINQAIQDTCAGGTSVPVGTL